ncbi:3-oxoacyl-[acyl-carrier protein] reductase [Williamsia limnetica]|uniref:3-oxoacyl-[acyl-carrier-protein] reductase MabA n=1 Tax=Williamsia limnetica TaxID=882452 RepID=A0A318REF7_WILLI|nr:SDR family NAD(P)-dependent oxidoreductase [Williamsia limnetica]PYE12445.1 3-oxoacyl-[acyl-carrier protein] reductase [Williamsia limnetica]
MTLSFDFSGRTVLVTGAAQGIGKALADHFVGAAARVVVADRDAELLKQQWPDEGESVLRLELDVADAESVRVGIEQVVRTWGSIDVVVNNAGVARDAVVWKMTDEQWDTVLAVHVTGTFNLTRAAVPHMRTAGFGRIINVTSYTGMHGNIGQSNYAAAKGGIIGFTKSVAKETARFGITCNAISPNAATAMVAAVPPEKLAEMTATVPMGRFADPSEMAAAVAFLASDEAAYITGVVLPVDGGVSM